MKTLAEHRVESGQLVLQFTVDYPQSELEWIEMRKICCLTALSGEAIERSRWGFFGELWVGAYQRLLPRWSYIAKRNGEVIGYLTGCPDTKEFEVQKKWLFTARLLIDVVRGKFDLNADVKRFLQRSLWIEKSPNDLFPQETLRKIASKYPAHLHINFKKEFRGAGIGSALIEKFCSDLKVKGITGAHVFCGEKPVSFYLKQGFIELGRLEIKKNMLVFALGKTLAES